MATQRDTPVLQVPGARPPPDTLPDREARNPFLRYFLHLGLPLVVSIGLHLGAVGFATVYGFSVLARPPIEVGEYSASLTESLADRMANAFSWSETSLLTAPDESVPALDNLANLLDVPEVDLSDLRQTRPDESIGPGTGGLGIGDGALSLLGTGSGAGEAGTGGFGEGLGGGGGRLGQAGVWDLNIRANKVAYVVDFSGSILMAVDDLKRELKRSVGQLTPAQSFNVIIFYSAGGGVDERFKTEAVFRGLQPATEQSRRTFFGWIDGKAPGGETRPLDALKQALTMEPEALFFFSDGIFDDSVVDQLGKANERGQTLVNCLVFDEQYLGDTSGLAPREDEAAARMRRIAQDNRGKFKIVTGKDLRR